MGMTLEWRQGGRGADESYVAVDVDGTGAENERPLIEFSPGFADVEVIECSPSAPATPPWADGPPIPRYQ